MSVFTAGDWSDFVASLIVALCVSWVVVQFYYARVLGNRQVPSKSSIRVLFLATYVGTLLLAGEVFAR